MTERTKGVWGYHKIIQDNVFEITTDDPRGQNSNGYIATISTPSYSNVRQAEANSAYIVKAVNHHEELVACLTETLEQFQYSLENSRAILLNNGIDAPFVSKNTTVIKAKKLLES